MLISYVVAVLLLLAAATGLIAHYRASGRAVLLGVTAFSPYLMLGAPLAAVLLLATRQWLPALVPVLLTAACVVTQLPLYTATRAPSDAYTVVTMTANLRLGRADPAAVVDAVRRDGIDVLMLEELTPEEQQRLLAAGLGRLLPHHFSAPGDQAEGTGLWSRFPLIAPRQWGDFVFAFVTASVRLPGVESDVLLAAGHMSGPWPNSSEWLYDMRRAAVDLPRFGGTGPVILGGDFNATPDTRQFRALLTHGYADAAAQAGAGMTPTYPADRAFPPLIAIDHVLTREAVATSVATVQIPGSDHRALIARVAVPRSS